MLNKLTRIKFILVILLFVVFFLKRNDLKDFFTNHNLETKQENSQVVVLNEKNKDKQKAIAKIGIILADIGLQKDVVEKSLNTNPKINIGVSAYADNLTTITNESISQYHHTTMVLLPTQPANYMKNDPGPLAMLIDSSIPENARKFNDIISKLTSNEIGLYISPISTFPFKEEKAMSLLKLLEDYESKFKFFAYYDRDGANLLTRLLSKSHISNKVITFNKIIDDSDPSAIVASLDDLGNMSISQNRTCIGIVAPKAKSVEIINEWLKKNSDKVELISISDILKMREAKDHK